jgi:hypothetical protein
MISQSHDGWAVEKQGNVVWHNFHSKAPVKTTMMAATLAGLLARCPTEPGRPNFSIEAIDV